MTMQCDVAVLGAGLAGLCAARDLIGAGLNVAVLEARDRVGGRTLTVPFEAAGLRVDLGAEWVAPAHHVALMEELRSYGIGLEPAPEESGDSVLKGLSANAISVLRELESISKQVDPTDPAWYAAMGKFDVPMAAYLRSCELDESSERLILAHSFALQGAHPDDYSLINLLHEFAAFGGVEQAFGAAEHRIVGGTQALSVAISESITSSVHFNWPIEVITQSDAGVAIAGPRGHIEAGQVIIALPLNVLKNLTLDIDLPDAAQAVIRQRHAGRAAKGWTRAQIQDAVTSSGWPDAVEVYSRQGSLSDAVCTFAVAHPDHSQGLAKSWEALSRRHTDVILAEASLSHDWVEDPYAMGSWLSLYPGQAEGVHQLADNPPPCLFAGGDLSRGWYGWMEGAVSSGRDAAVRLLAYRQRGELRPAQG